MGRPELRTLPVVDISRNTNWELLGLTIRFIRGSDRKRRFFHICKCRCGTLRLINETNLRSPSLNKTCNQCTGDEYGPVKNPNIYYSFMAMKSRCYDPNNIGWYLYGGRGIRICQEWLDDPKVFCRWAIENGWDAGLSIERIDVNGSYEPGNCKWANNKEQARNQRRNKMVTLNGVTRCIAEWAEVLSLDSSVICQRLRLGWSDERTLTTPVRPLQKSGR